MAALGVAVLGFARAATAEPTAAEMATRRALINEATAASDAGDHVKALERYRRAGALLLTPSLRFTIAQEQEATGALAEAFGNAQLCGIEAQNTPKVPDRRKLMQGCKDLESALASRVARVIIDVRNSPEGLRVNVAGHVVNSAALGIPYVVNPGQLNVDAEAPGFAPHSQRLQIAEGKTETVIVSLVPLPPAVPDKPKAEPQGPLASAHAPAPIQIPVAAPAPPAVVITAPPAQSPSARDEDRSWRPIGMWLGTAGLVALSGAGVVYLVSDTKYSAAKESCEKSGNCLTDTNAPEAKTIDRLDTIAVIGAVSGGVMVMTGAALYFWPRTANAEPLSLRASPGRYGMRLLLEGRF